jgi:hypothetical protein
MSISKRVFEEDRQQRDIISMDLYRRGWTELEIWEKDDVEEILVAKREDYKAAKRESYKVANS